MTATMPQHNRSTAEQSAIRKLLARPMMPASIAGTGCIMLGVGLFLAMAASEKIEGEQIVLRLGQTGIIIGAFLLGYASLRKKGRSIEEAYRLGYDVGFENGYRSGAEPVVRHAWESRERREHPAVADQRRH